MFSRLLAALAVSALSAPIAVAQVTINEFVYDHGGTDFDEYIELYNSGPAAVNIGDWVIDAEDQAFPASGNTDITIPAGTMLPGFGFYLIANATTQSPVLAAADQLFTGSFENSMESFTLRDANGNVVDAVMYESAADSYTPDPEQIEGAGIRGEQRAFGYNGGSLNLQSFSRILDGYDTDNNGADFRMSSPTPGATNVATFDAIGQGGYLLDVDVLINNLVSGSKMPNWTGSCEDPELIDYASIGIPQSPLDAIGSPTDPNTDLVGRMGCVATNDSIGGSFWFESVPSSSYVLEAYVYIEAAPTDPGAGEYWHIGFHGTSAYFFNLPAPVWNGAFNDVSDVTGAGLTYVCDDTSATLSLVDYGDGSIVNVLGSMPVTTGWTRVRLQATQNFIECHIGGTFGQRDGTLLSGPLSGTNVFGAVYGGYRKSGNTGTGIGRGPSPFYVDTLVINGSNVDSRYFGSPTANSIGDPVLELAGLPHLGNAAFGFAASGLVPSSTYFQLIGLNGPGTGLDISAALPGAVPAGLTLWVPTNFAAAQPSADASGLGGTTIPLPMNPSLIGGQLWAQVMQQDSALGLPLPISATKAIRFTLGN